MLYCGTDDIEVDEPITEASTSSPDVKNKQKGKSLSKLHFMVQLQKSVTVSYVFLQISYMIGRNYLKVGLKMI